MLKPKLIGNSMQIKNTINQFGVIAIVLHWIMAILLIALVALGLYMVRVPISAEKLKLYGWHKEFGILALMLVIVRLTWRLINVTPSLISLPWWERYPARAAHWAFYVLMFLIPVSGWLITSAAGLPVSVFGWFTLPNLVVANEVNRMLFTEIHMWLGYFLIVVFCLHVSGALKHYLINRDDIMQRMIKP